MQTSFDRYPVSALRPSRAFIWALAAIKKAAAETNCETGSLEPELAEAIQQAAQEVMDGLWDEAFTVNPYHSGPGDYPHMASRVIAGRAAQILEQAEILQQEYVDQNQTEAEVVGAALRLGNLKSMEGLLEAIRILLTEMEGKPQAASRMERPSAQELSEDSRAIIYHCASLQSAAEAFHRISMDGAAGSAAVYTRPGHQSGFMKQLSQTSGITAMLSDHTSQSMQTLAEIDAFSTALRNLLMSLERTAGKLERPTETISGQPANLRLNEAKSQLQVVDLTLAMAGQSGGAARTVVMPVVAYLLFDVLEGVGEAVWDLAGRLSSSMIGQPFQVDMLAVTAECEGEKEMAARLLH